MSNDLTSGKWFLVKTPEQHQNLKKCGKLEYKPFNFARVQIGTYDGPGHYMLLQYYQRCPRNCCDDNVNEVLSLNEVITKAKKDIRELADVLKTSKLMKEVEKQQ